jgi:hypothetical protein
MPTKAFRTDGVPLSPSEPQTFAEEGDRARLSNVAIKAFLNLAGAWKLTNADSADLLGLSGSSLDRIRKGNRPTLNQDQLTRISALVGIYKGLHLLFADETANTWPQLPNKAPLFEHQSPVASMIKGGIPRMLDVRRYIDAVRGGL